MVSQSGPLRGKKKKKKLKGRQQLTIAVIHTHQ